MLLYLYILNDITILLQLKLLSIIIIYCLFVKGLGDAMRFFFFIRHKVAVDVTAFSLDLLS